MAERDNYQASSMLHNGETAHEEEYKHSADACNKSVSKTPSDLHVIERRKHQNGIVTNILTTTDDAENGESADSGHGSIGQDCDCAIAVESEVNMMEQLTLERVADNLHDNLSHSQCPQSACQRDAERIDQDCVRYVVYESELQMPHIIKLITKDLSEPYSIYTYRYFIHNWPRLCLLAMDGEECVGAIVCKLDMHRKMVRRGYIAMLAVDEHYRRQKIGSSLVMKAIHAMMADYCDEVVLETEITNKAALRLYENLGFIRDKRLFRYYLNGVDALRLKLWLR